MAATPAPIKILTTKVKWKVKRSAFDTPEGSKSSIQSEKFQASSDSKISWFLLLYPRSGSDEDRDYASLYLATWNLTSTDSVRVKFKLGFIASDETEKNGLNLNKLINKNNWGWGRHKFIKRDVLLDPTQDFFRDNQLTIFCDLQLYWSPLVQTPEFSLGNGLMGILESGEFSDAILVVGAEEIKAHKNVLAAGSPVFAAMFKYNMTENQTGRVEIKDLDVVGVKALLSFLYSGEVKDLKAIVEKVLPAADKYGVTALKSLCEKEICENLSVENVADMLSLAELHNSREMKAQALGFISLNATEVLEQDSFWDLYEVNQDLLREAVRFSNMRSQERSDESQVERKCLK